ncbi:MAG: hypothetical protein Q9176_007874 [Flavoplaca citrina]
MSRSTPSRLPTAGATALEKTQSIMKLASHGLEINKSTKQWRKKRHLEGGLKLGKRASIPMTNTSGIEANGPWFDGVEALRGAEMNAVDAAQAKAKRMSA